MSGSLWSGSRSERLNGVQWGAGTVKSWWLGGEAQGAGGRPGKRVRAPGPVTREEGVGRWDGMLRSLDGGW